MNKRERISQWLAESTGEDVNADQAEVETHPYYRAFFRCWNEQRYYEAHDVLEQLWLNTDSPDADFFKGLIQAAGAFVHLQKSASNIRCTPSTAGVCLRRCVCFGSRREIWRTLCRRHHALDVADALPAFEPIRRSRSSRRITQSIRGPPKPRR